MTRSAEQNAEVQAFLDKAVIRLRKEIEAAGFAPVVTEVVLYEGFADPVFRSTDVHPRYEGLATSSHPSRWKKKAG